MKKTFFYAAALVFALPAAGLCARAAEGDPAAAATSTEQAKPRVISIRQALTQPDEFKDERVLLVGQFMGFNGGCNTKQPVGAGDVMIHDKQGLCIYANGPLPDSFSAVERKGFGEQITLSGFVIKQEVGPPFFLVPYTKGTKKSAPLNPRALLGMRMAKEGEIKVYAVETVLTTPDKYVAKPMGIKGMAARGAESCKTAPPEYPDPEVETWILAGADGRCVRVLGPFPLKTDAATPALATVKGYLDKSAAGFHFRIIEEEPKPQEKKPIIKIDGGK